MEEIGAHILSGRIFLKKIILRNINEIAEKEFYECENLENVVVPKNVTKIGLEAFAWSRLKSIILPHGLTKIGEKTFYYCRELENVFIPETVTEIGPGAFSWSGLKSIILPDGPNQNWERCILQLQ